MRVSGYRGQKRFGEKTGINQKTLSRYERDTKPTQPALGKMVKATRCSAHWLLTGEGEMFEEFGPSTERQRPEGGGLPAGTIMCYGTVKCGQYPAPEDGRAFPQDIGAEYTHPDNYGLVAAGESMAPLIRPGDFLVLERYKTKRLPRNGAIVEASITMDNNSFNTVKRYFITESYVELRPEVPRERDPERRPIILLKTKEQNRYRNAAGLEVGMCIEGVLRGLHRKF